MSEVSTYTDEQKKAIKDFVSRVEREAESNMLKTGKLEGSHYAAMIKLRDALCEK